MGDVYRATDPRLGRDVAFKTLPKAEPDDAHAVERFLQEARLTASLDHPNIVKVFDVGMSNGRPYLVSELLEGETLRAPISGGRSRRQTRAASPPRWRAAWGRARARLGASRSQAGEHLRDRRDRQDPGLRHREARAGSALPRGLATLTGVILGTAGYLAPEQVKGEPVDARTDLFALGSILFELMTGQRAFAREHTIDTLHAIVHDDPPDLLPEGTRTDRHRRRGCSPRRRPPGSSQPPTCCGRWSRSTRPTGRRRRRRVRAAPADSSRPGRGCGHRGRRRHWRWFLSALARRVAAAVGQRACPPAQAHAVHLAASAGPGSTPHRSSRLTGAVLRSRRSSSDAPPRLFVRSLDSRETRRPLSAPMEPNSRSGRPTARRSGSSPAAS